LVAGVFLLVACCELVRATELEQTDETAAETTATDSPEWLAQAETKPAPLPPGAVPSKKRQPTVPVEPRETTPPPDLQSLLAMDTITARGGDRLASMPNMFGDAFNVGGQLSVMKGVVSAVGDLPLAAACRRVKVAENNKALPQDRIYFLYNHFQNSLATEVDQSLPAAVLDRRDFSVDRYTIGMEKTLFDGLWSVEVRMPLADRINYTSPAFDSGGGNMVDFGVSGGEIGNLAVLLKRLIYESDTTAISVGLGVDMPTGSDANATFDTHSYTLRNQAVHLLPYAGIAWAPRERFFSQGFLQVDVPTNGNRADYFNPGSGTFGILDEQTLLYADVSVGYWLHHNPNAPVLTGLAAVVEFHYTTTLNDADSISGPVGLATFGNLANRMDIPNLTVGLHSELANRTLVRVGGVFPLSTGDNRWFDAEFQAQVERRF
jgi:hypothetical protein